MNLSPGMRRILIALDRDGDMGIDEIAEAVPLARNTLDGGRYLTALLSVGLIRVSRWERQDRSGPPRAIYSISPGKSKPKPRPYTAAQKCRRWKRRVGYRSAEWRRNQSLKQLTRIAK